MGADFILSIVYVLGGEMAARLLNFAILLVLLGLLHAAVRLWVSPGIAWLLVALFATTPMVQLVTGSLFVENLLAAFHSGMMTALWRFGESGERRSLYLAAALGGTAMAIKFGAIAILAPALVCAAAEVWRRRKADRRTAGPRRRTPAVGAAAPPYGIAWIKTGNRSSRLPTTAFTPATLAPKAGFRDTRFHDPLTWKTPYDLTFRTTRYYEGQIRLVRFSVSAAGAPRPAGAVAGAPPSGSDRSRGREQRDSADPRYRTQRALSLLRAALALRAVRGAARVGGRPSAPAGAHSSGICH